MYRPAFSLKYIHLDIPPEILVFMAFQKQQHPLVFCYLSTHAIIDLRVIMLTKQYLKDMTQKTLIAGKASIFLCARKSENQKLSTFAVEGEIVCYCQHFPSFGAFHSNKCFESFNLNQVYKQLNKWGNEMHMLYVKRSQTHSLMDWDLNCSHVPKIKFKRLLFRLWLQFTSGCLRA